jgi:hypothetical protein
MIIENLHTQDRVMAGQPFQDDGLKQRINEELIEQKEENAAEVLYIEQYI